MQRTGSIARYGTPYGTPDRGIPRALEDRGRRLWTEPIPEPKPEPKPIPDPRQKPKEDDRRKSPRLGRIYVTYLKIQDKTGLVYTGRTDMLIDLNEDLETQALIAMYTRGLRHEKDEEDYSLAAVGPLSGPLSVFDEITEAALTEHLDKYDEGRAINPRDKWKDFAYRAIRGREQQSIDAYGGAWTDTNEKGLPHATGNKIRAVSKHNQKGWIYHQAATQRFGELHKYTGY
jgi:hypothetical protein